MKQTIYVAISEDMMEIVIPHYPLKHQGTDDTGLGGKYAEEIVIERDRAEGNDNKNRSKKTLETAESRPQT